MRERAQKNRTRVPRASLSVTMLGDVELIRLVQTSAGRDAALLFVMLILAAKDQDNGGTFTEPPEVLAMLVRWPLDDFKCALEKLLETPGQWIVESDGAIAIRSFDKWNRGWGGARENSGRKPIQETKPATKRNQVAQLGATPASVTVFKSVCAPENGPQFQRDFWDAYPKIPNKLNANRSKAEHEWHALTGEQRAQAVKAVNVFAAAVMSRPPERRKKVIGPVAFLANREFPTDPAAWADTANTEPQEVHLDAIRD